MSDDTMTDTVVDVHGVPLLRCAPHGPVLRGEADATDLVGAALGLGAEVVAVPVARLPEEFFTLRTRLAGEIAQKFVNYRLTLAIVGDVSGRTAASGSLRDFVAEANRGRQLWFVASEDELVDRLRAAANR